MILLYYCRAVERSGINTKSDNYYHYPNPDILHAFVWGSTFKALFFAYVLILLDQQEIGGQTNKQDHYERPCINN